MKLHLPLGLLSSLIACMAAVSSPHALAETYTWLGGTDGWIHTNANWNPAPTNYANVWLSLIHISEPTRLGMISYAVFCLKKKQNKKKKKYYIREDKH